MSVLPTKTAAMRCSFARLNPNKRARCGAIKPIKLRGPTTKVALTVNPDTSNNNNMRDRGTFSPKECALGSPSGNMSNQRWQIKPMESEMAVIIVSGIKASLVT